MHHHCRTQAVQHHAVLRLLVARRPIVMASSTILDMDLLGHWLARSCQWSPCVVLWYWQSMRCGHCGDLPLKVKWLCMRTHYFHARLRPTATGKPFKCIVAGWFFWLPFGQHTAMGKSLIHCLGDVHAVVRCQVWILRVPYCH
jgi:hypothetical protein